MLAKHPRFTAIAVLTLATRHRRRTPGIFRFCAQVVLPKIAVPHPEQLVLHIRLAQAGHVSSDESGAPERRGRIVSYRCTRICGTAMSVFTGLAAKDTFSATLTTGEIRTARADVVSETISRH